jgi:hypothetical protein
MIQRKQTLFLFQVVFMGIALLFIPSVTIIIQNISTGVTLVPLNMPDYHSTAGHIAAIALNFLGLVLAFVAVFMYNRRELQVKLCYVITFIWVLITLMIAFCPFVEGNNGSPVQTKINFLAIFIGIFGVFAAVLAARYIKKDIELIRSSDRIR